MAYSKTNWVNNTTPINETNLNKIEQEIYDNSLVVDAITNTLNPTDTETYKTAELTEGQITDVIGVNDIKLKGNTTQNGTPTPGNPVDINVVTGNQNVEICSKNIIGDKFDTKNGSTSSGVKSTYTNSTIYLSGTITNYYYFNFHLGNFKINKGDYTIAFFSDKLMPKVTRIIIQLHDTNSTVLSIAQGEFKSFTVNEDLKKVSIFFSSIANNNITFTNTPLKVMLFKGIVTEMPDYEPYQGSIYPISLGDMELCKIGDYQDYFYKSGSIWYLHKEINKITSYNGETITTSYISTTGKLSTGAKVYYVVTPTDTKITDTTLISQLEAIYNAPLYEQTNITQTNNDLPMVLDITACKDNIKGIKAFIRK